ncbi:glycosyltransferase family 4 protein [Candidatus Kuenenbacteria bacterium]|nr:glycosyltransferase family 4 protein [Candidatus Kuenenbacteria bacterium]
MKKILFFATIPASIKEFSLDYMQFLKSKSYEVEAAAGVAHQTEYVRSQGFKCYDFEIPRGIDPLGDWKAFRAIYKIIKQGNYDVVHTQTAKAGFIGRVAAKLNKVPLIIHTAHAWPFHPFLSKPLKFYYLFLEKFCAKLCDNIIVDTKTVRDYGLQNKVTKTTKIKQIYMGIDTEKFHPLEQTEKQKLRNDLNISQDKIVIGSISRLVEDKGIEILIACAEKLKDKDNVLFLHLGEGPLRSQFKKQIKTAGVEHMFKLLGYKNDVLPFYNIFDIYCLPTKREGFGVVFAEALACEVPVIASDIAPLNNEIIVNGETGLLCKEKDVDRFTEAISKLFDPNLRQKLGQNGRKYIYQNFNINKTNQQTLDHYRHLWQTKFKENF